MKIVIVMLLVSSTSLWDLLRVNSMCTNLCLHLSSVFAGLQHSVTSKFTIYRAFYLCEILFLC